MKEGNAEETSAGPSGDGNFSCSLWFEKTARGSSRSAARPASLQISRKSIIRLTHRSRCCRPVCTLDDARLAGINDFPIAARLAHVYSPVGLGRQSKRGTKAVFLLSLFSILINLHGKNQASPRRSQSDHFLPPFSPVSAAASPSRQ